MTSLKKILQRTQKAELITDKFDPNRFEYAVLNLSKKNKLIMSYNTHKKHQLLVLKNKDDKDLIQKYIKEKINI